MSTKKIVLIVVGILGVLALLVVLFVVGIGWFVFSTIGNSEAAETARTYLRTNEELKRDIGEVKDFGSFVTGNINTENQNGEATLEFESVWRAKDCQCDGLALRIEATRTGASLKRSTTMMDARSF